MKGLKLISIAEEENMSSEEKREYYESLRSKLTKTGESANPTIGSKILAKINPLYRNYKTEIYGEENIPKNDSSLFVINHSNSHDAFTTVEVFDRLNKTATILASSECLNLPTLLMFKSTGAIMLDRREKTSRNSGSILLSQKLVNGKNGVIFSEGTWNLHPVKPMQNLRTGAARISLISRKAIVPTIFEYLEVDDMCEKDPELYKKCIVLFGKPIYVDERDSLIEKTEELQSRMEEMRRSLWNANGVRKGSIDEIDKELYLNHTYVKKFNSFGFTFDSEAESRLLYSKDGNVENKCTISIW